jgi:hypothetical protein
VEGFDSLTWFEVKPTIVFADSILNSCCQAMSGTLPLNMASNQRQKGNLEMHHTLHIGLHHLSTIIDVKALHGEATREELEKAIVDSRPVPEWSWKFMES